MARWPRTRARERGFGVIGELLAQREGEAKSAKLSRRRLDLAMVASVKVSPLMVTVLAKRSPGSVVALRPRSWRRPAGTGGRACSSGSLKLLPSGHLRLVDLFTLQRGLVHGPDAVDVPASSTRVSSAAVLTSDRHRLPVAGLLVDDPVVAQQHKAGCIQRAVCPERWR